MTSALGHRSRVGAAGLRTGSAARELAGTLLLGAVGGGLIFLASRPGWAHVRTVPPRPLPASDVPVTGAQLVPYADALVIAGLATLAAVLATRGLLRRLAGVLLAAIGVVLAVSAFTVTTAGAVAAAEAGLGPASAAAGSVMNGSTPAAAVPNVAGSTPHVVISAAGWQAMVVAGALAMIGAGVLVTWRARRLAVMSSRYDSPAGAARRPAAAAPADSASLWEALSRGHDPTTGSSQAGR